ncbi:hypothetical protein OG875_05695 [Streptomyces sp. NBC_01498]|uniref:hypothetical protein n=1 Tax=Streptomyces sp. NBC_01498 TaxID=2975870 RepID=UPI002E7B7A5C|nr:hypothetical protein [Streptomyces sp. NBC_01498]WTL24147.1 hypothetical protein OG875_05695 [Streptomyces sp. NBC_01498]
MRRTDDHASLSARLEQAEVLTHTYDDYDIEAARRRVTAPAPAVAPSAGPDAPREDPAAHEQADRDLDLAVALIVDTPQAASALGRLVDEERPDPEGAVVFAALLHLTGDHDAAQFWWQFAAGGGNRTAAFCLYLAHQRRAEFSDATYWRDQARNLHAPTPVPPPVLRGSLLPERVRHRLLAQCRTGRRPTLPARLEALINRLPVDSPDHDFGPIPRPVDTLPDDLPLATEPGAGGGRS